MLRLRHSWTLFHPAGLIPRSIRQPKIPMSIAGGDYHCVRSGRNGRTAHGFGADGERIWPAVGTPAVGYCDRRAAASQTGESWSSQCDRRTAYAMNNTLWRRLSGDDSAHCKDSNECFSFSRCLLRALWRAPICLDRAGLRRHLPSVTGNQLCARRVANARHSARCHWASCTRA